MILALAYAAALDLNLICSGHAETEDSQPTISVSSTPHGTEFASGSSTTTKGMDDTLYVRLSGDAGEVKFPTLIAPPGSSSKPWRPIKNIVAGDTEITGTVPYGLTGRAKLRLDRVAGTITISSMIGRFSGNCSKFDAAAPPVKF